MRAVMRYKFLISNGLIKAFSKKGERLYKGEGGILTYVRPPKPIVVKKLMANLVFLGLSLGMMPAKYGDSVL